MKKEKETENWRGKERKNIGLERKKQTNKPWQNEEGKFDILKKEKRKKVETLTKEKKEKKPRIVTVRKKKKENWTR